MFIIVFTFLFNQKERDRRKNELYERDEDTQKGDGLKTTRLRHNANI